MTLEERRIVIYNECLVELGSFDRYKLPGYARKVALEAMRRWGQEEATRGYRQGCVDTESRNRSTPGSGDMGG